MISLEEAQELTEHWAAVYKKVDAALCDINHSIVDACHSGKWFVRIEVEALINAEITNALKKLGFSVVQEATYKIRVSWER